MGDESTLRFEEHHNAKVLQHQRQQMQASEREQASLAQLLSKVCSGSKGRQRIPSLEDIVSGIPVSQPNRSQTPQVVEVHTTFLHII
eukprot:m.247031 g.247031  ORF g.247031 m.247031 type:complete len:87 (+) comp15389_c8_seq3:441-701(+)